MKKISKIIFFATIISFIIACNKLVDQNSPKNLLSVDKVFADSIGAKSALFNIYVILQTQNSFCNPYLSAYSDESMLSQSSLLPWNQSRLTTADPSNTSNWSNLYTAIYQANVVIEQMASSPLPPAFKKQMLAEATFLRAYCYFLLVNMYGHIPLIIDSDVNLSRTANQSDSAFVYKQIGIDLAFARENLGTGYAGTGRIRANKACATALLARLNLYQHNWSQAEAFSSELINDNTYQLESLPNVFKITSKESILQFATQNGYTTDAGNVLPSSAVSIPGSYLSDTFYNSFEPGDNRKTNWIGTSTVTTGGSSLTYRYPYKYKNRTTNTTTPENLVVLRLAEQYLIRAEARSHSGNLVGANSASSDINALRGRAGLAPTISTTQIDIVNAIANERLHEIFYENGDRFFDLKRTGKLNQLMMSYKPTWPSYGIDLPIPISNINSDPNLIQNAGY